MPAQIAKHGFSQHRTSFVIAVLLVAGWLSIPGDLTKAYHASALKAVTQDAAKIQSGDPWSQFPFESRELWKFRLTTRR